MKRTPQQPPERAQLNLDLVMVKELLRDLLFREAGQPYFKRFAVPPSPSERGRGVRGAYAPVGEDEATVRASSGVRMRGSTVTVCTGVGLAGMGARMWRKAVSIWSSTPRRGMHSSTTRRPGSWR